MRSHTGTRQPVLATVRSGVTVFLVLALCLAVTGCAPKTDSPPAATTVWHQTHEVSLPAGWRVSARNAGPTGESSSLDGPHGAGCLVSTWTSRPERLWWPVSPRRVTVQGSEATYGELDPDYGPYPRAVVWADHSGQWFRVSCDVEEAGILQIAEGVHAGVHPMHVPYRLSAMPPGMSMVALIESVDGGSRRVSALFDLPTSRRPLTMEISNVSDSWYAQGDVEQRDFSGRPAEVRAATQTICFRTRSDPICIQGPGDEPASDWSPAAREAADRTAELLTPVADPADETTWWDADVAFPG